MLMRHGLAFTLPETETITVTSSLKMVGFQVWSFFLLQGSRPLFSGAKTLVSGRVKYFHAVVLAVSV